MEWNDHNNYLILFIQLGKYQFEDMNVYIAPFIDNFLVLWNGFTMYDISRPIGQKKFKFHAMLVWTIHDALGLTHFYDMLWWILVVCGNSNSKN